MDKEELDNVIEKLRQENSAGIAAFGLHYGHEDQLHIRANKQGLELFAAELLIVSRDLESITKNESKKYINLEYDKGWLDGEMIHYIKPILESREEIQIPEPSKETYKDKACRLGCMISLACVAISICVGIYSIFQWIFS